MKRDFNLLDKIPSDSWRTMMDLFHLINPPYCSATMTTRLRELVASGHVKTGYAERIEKVKGVNPILYCKVLQGVERTNNFRKCLCCRGNFIPQTKYLFRCDRCRNTDEFGMNYSTGMQRSYHAHN